MADPLAIIHDLVRRVGRLEEGRAVDPRAARAPANLRAPDPDSAAILRYLQSSHTKFTEDREVVAIRSWLRTPSPPPKPRSR